MTPSIARTRLSALSLIAVLALTGSTLAACGSEDSNNSITSSSPSADRETGSPRLATANSAKRTEMLLAAHAAAGAVSLSKTAAAAVAGETVVAVRHLNVPVLMRVGMLALKVRSDAATRAASGASSWSQLLEDEAATWTRPEAIAIAELLEEPETTS